MPVLSLKALAERLGGSPEGDPEKLIEGIAPIEKAGEGETSFIANSKYLKYVQASRAGAIIIDKKTLLEGKNLIRVADPYFAFFQCLQLFYPQTPLYEPGIHPSASLDPSVKLGKSVAIRQSVVIEKNTRIGDGVIIAPQVFIGADCEIGEGTLIHARVCIRERTMIGKRVIIQSGAVIGGDGFGYVQKEGVWCKIPQVGNVVIEDDVEIGANTTIDRAVLGSTIIGRGTKLDNLVMVAHNVTIGEHSAVAAQAGFSGSTKVGHHALVGGQAGFAGHLQIGNHAVIIAQSGVTKDLPDDSIVSGFFARPHRDELRIAAYLKELPELIPRIRKEIKTLNRTNPISHPSL